MCQKRSLSYTGTMLNAKDIFTETAIDAAYIWLCKSRANFPANADIWHLRFYWSIIHTTTQVA